MIGLPLSRRTNDAIVFFIFSVGLVLVSGCSDPEGAANQDGGLSDVGATETPDLAGSEPKEASPEAPSSKSAATQPKSDTEAQPREPGAADTTNPPETPAPGSKSAAGETPTSTESGKPVEIDGGERSLDALLAKVEVPPPWLHSVETRYDTSHPWKEARLEIRRLLSLGKPETHREAIKLTWLYLQKGDIGDGHEYPMYTFLGGEPLWSIRAHEEFINKPHEHTPIHSYLTLASLYTQYGEFEKAKARLDEAMAGLPNPPWRIMRKADLLAAYGNLYAAWGKLDEAKESYAEAAALYPTAKPPYGRHLLPRRAAGVQSKLDLLTFRSLASATLHDGQYRVKALGYANDIHVTVSIGSGRITDIQIKHEEKIDQNACAIIPRRIVERQSLQVDGISGATVTKDAIVDGVYHALKQAGLE